VRKVRILFAEKHLAYEFVEDNVWAAGTLVGRFNPLTKVPVLILDDGTPLYDSSVIAEYVDALASPAWLPAAPLPRALARRSEALADGICDAAVAIVLERRREDAPPGRADDGSPPQQDRCLDRDTVDRSSGNRPGSRARRRASPTSPPARRVVLRGVPLAGGGLARALREPEALAERSRRVRPFPPRDRRPLIAQAMTPPPRHSSPR
jgi:hypothetical protein